MKTFECPQCGAEVRVGRLSCPECGSDESTGWGDGEDIDYQSVDLPEGEFSEPGPKASRVGGIPRPLAMVVLVLTLLGFLWLAVFWRG